MSHIPTSVNSLRLVSSNETTSQSSIQSTATSKMKKVTCWRKKYIYLQRTQRSCIFYSLYLLKVSKAWLTESLLWREMYHCWYTLCFSLLSSSLVERTDTSAFAALKTTNHQKKLISISASCIVWISNRPQMLSCCLLSKWTFVHYFLEGEVHHPWNCLHIKCERIAQAGSTSHDQAHLGKYILNLWSCFGYSVLY